jgi:hypothetical protein
MGVAKPITLKSKEVMLFVANKYIDPENKKTPERTKMIIFFWFYEINHIMLINIRNNAWYIW